MTRSQLRAVIRRAQLSAVLLRDPVARIMGLRERMADDLETLAAFATDILNGRRAPEVPPLYDQTADDDATEADLLGGAA